MEQKEFNKFKIEYKNSGMSVFKALTVRMNAKRASRNHLPVE